jgi:hypothetical protein
VTTAARGLGLLALTACLIVCRQAGGGERGAGSAVHAPEAAVPAPAKTAAAPDAGVAPVAGDAARAAAVPNETTPTPAPSLKPAACAQLRQHVEQQLVAAQRCKDTDECVATFFEYAFRPCGISVRKGAPLDKVAGDAKRYQDQCHPITHPVKCAYLPRALCARGRCVLAAPATN